jgi:hypothetical protein
LKDSKKSFAEALAGLSLPRNGVQQQDTKRSQEVAKPHERAQARTHPSAAIRNPLKSTASPTRIARSAYVAVIPAAVKSEKTALQKAQWCVGTAMGTCLGMWFLPFVSGVAVNTAESVMVGGILKSVDCYSKAGVDSVFWFFRKKMFILNLGTYVPVAGVALQLFETYALGQFAIHCSRRPECLSDEDWMARNWAEIEEDVFSGYHAIKSYEQFTGSTFPEFARGDFIRAVDLLSKVYRTAEKVPGLSRAQEVAGQTVREVIGLTKRIVPRAAVQVTSASLNLAAKFSAFLSKHADAGADACDAYVKAHKDTK